MKAHSPNRQRRSPARAIAGAIGTLVLLTASAAMAQPAPALVENAREVTATVSAIEQDTRLVSLRTPNGHTITMEASEQVRNFAQIEVGDKVNVLFYEAIAVELTSTPDNPGEVSIASAAAGVPLGERPAGAAGNAYTAVVAIDSVDLENHTVSFTGPAGLLRTVSVERPEMRQFIAGLSPGDHVEITYAEAVAVEVTPAEE